MGFHLDKGLERIISRILFGADGFIHRVCTPGHGKPGKSWNLRISFSRPEKSWNFMVGHGKSWKIRIDLFSLYVLFSHLRLRDVLKPVKGIISPFAFLKLFGHMHVQKTTFGRNCSLE